MSKAEELYNQKRYVFTNWRYFLRCISDLILMGCWQKWPEPVIDCLLDLASFLHPAYEQRQRIYKRYGVKEK